MALVVGAAIAVAVVRGGEVAPSTAAERVEVAEPKLLNTEPWGQPNSELLAEILDPSSPAVTGGAIAPPSEVIMVEIGGFAIAEPDAAAQKPAPQPDRADLSFEVIEPHLPATFTPFCEVAALN